MSDDPDEHDVEIRLRDENRNVHPIDNTCVPLLHHITLPDVEHDEWKGVDKGEDKHRPENPAMEDLRLFMGNASQADDPIRFRRCNYITNMSALDGIENQCCSHYES